MSNGTYNYMDWIRSLKKGDKILGPDCLKSGSSKLELKNKDKIKNYTTFIVTKECQKSWVGEGITIVAESNLEDSNFYRQITNPTELEALKPQSQFNHTHISQGIFISF